MDWGKHRYEQEQKDKDARRRQNQIVVKEIKMRPKISDNDYGTKAGHVKRFLLDGAKVRASIMFRGREMAHTELGLVLLQRLAADMQELASVEAEPKVDGRNMVMVLAPLKARIRAVPEPRVTDEDLLGTTMPTEPPAAPSEASAPPEAAESVEVSASAEELDDTLESA
jgi:translation initiation factor IF-3